MSKVKVQDATRELSTNAGRVLESLSRARKQTQEMLQALRRREENLLEMEAAAREEQRLNERRASMGTPREAFLSAYSSDAPDDMPSVAPPFEVIAVHESPYVEADDGVILLTPTLAVASEPIAKDEKPQETPSAPETSEPIKVASEASAEMQTPPQSRPVARSPQNAGQPRSDQPRSDQPRSGAQPGGQPFTPRQPYNAAGPYGRPVNPQQGTQPGDQSRSGQPFVPRQPYNPQGPYGRPVNPPQGGAQPGDQSRSGQPFVPRQPYNAQGPYGRPVNPQGGDQSRGAPFNRPAGPGGPPRPGMGAPFNRTGAPGGGGGRPGFGKKGPELAPTVEKEKVSNYDPNKKNYLRQHDPERVAKNRRQLAKQSAPGMAFDDDNVRGRKKRRSMAQMPELIRIEKAVMTAETITVKDLTERLGKPAGEIIKKLLMLGIMATINNELDFDTAQLVASEFGIDLELKLTKTAEDVLEDESHADTDEELLPRPPVVTIMGHVDHGKTSLLDYIRKTRVTEGEAGGITQHIGAYTVDVKGQTITFLDTPGHEAFTSMRARGAQATDIAILVVAADDGVMPQTIEAINHAKAAGVEMIIAINKIDKPGANPDRIMQQLTEYELVAEEWGGDTVMARVSAITGEGVPNLLDMILLIAEMQNYRANPNKRARGIIVEAQLDKGRGPVATVLIKSGTLRVGDTIVAGTAYGRVRAMVNDRGERVKEAGPSTPVEVIGFNEVPEAGDIIQAADDDRLSRMVAEERQDKARAALVKSAQKVSLDDLFTRISEGNIQDLNIVVKGDVQGSVEAVRQSLEKISNDEVRVKCIHGGVGAINRGDVMLAAASGAIIIGFNVRPDAAAREMAESEGVDIRLYRIIYQAIEDVQNAMKGMLAPKFKEVIYGHASVRQPFRVTGVGTIAGSYVTDGKIQRNALVRLLRDNVVIHEGKIDSLKRFKDDAREVMQGYECGIGLENYNDIKEGDVIECFQNEEVEK